MSEKKLVINVQCRACGKHYTVTVNEEDHIAWRSKVGPKRFTQTAFPYLSAGDRELLISQICDPCYSDMFKEEE